MAHSNKQPAGSRPGPNKAMTHAPHSAGMPPSQSQTPAPKGETKCGTIPPKGRPNKNVLH